MQNKCKFTKSEIDAVDTMIDFHSSTLKEEPEFRKSVRNLEKLRKKMEKC